MRLGIVGIALDGRAILRQRIFVIAGGVRDRAGAGGVETRRLTGRFGRSRAGNGCGRDYRVKGVVLVEVTACAFPASVPDIVMTNILARVPG